MQVGAGRLPTHPRRLLDAPQRPAQSPKCQNFLSFLVAQDVGHAGGGTTVLPPRQRLGVPLPHWPVFRCRRLAGFGCRPRTFRRSSSRGPIMTVRPLQSAWRFSRNELSGKPGAVQSTDPAMPRRACSSSARLGASCRASLLPVRDQNIALNLSHLHHLNIHRASLKGQVPQRLQLNPRRITPHDGYSGAMA